MSATTMVRRSGGGLTRLVRKLVTFELPTTKEAATRIGLLLTRAGICERHTHAPVDGHKMQVQRSEGKGFMRIISPKCPKLIVFPVSGLGNEQGVSRLAQTSSPARLESELERAWAPASKATKGKSTRMTLN